tara:strand:- start:170 stop:733 length:564 start_codon:yes stop_codon:yes gene_type:complete
MSVRLLLILHPNLEELEAVGPADILRRAGLEVTLASTSDSLLVTGRNQITLQADALLDGIAAEDFDALVIPGGPGVAGLRQDGRIAKLASTYAAGNKPVAAICAAPLLLKDAGLLGEESTPAAHFTCREEIPGLDGSSSFVEEGRLYTSRSAGDAIAFGLGLAARLAGREKAIEVARTICLGKEAVP